jgi:hypothetical protein
MLVVPLVMSSVMSGILGLGDVRKLGRPGAAAVAYYVSTTILAVFVGLVVVNLIQPGVGTVDEATLAEMEADSSATKDKIYDYLSTQADVPKEQVAEYFGDETKVEPTIALILRRNGTLRSRGGDLYRAGDRRRNDPDAPTHDRADGYAGGHRRGRDPRGRIGHHADRARRRRPPG